MGTTELYDNRQTDNKKTHISKTTRISTPINTDGGFTFGLSGGMNFKLVDNYLHGHARLVTNITKNVAYVNGLMFTTKHLNLSPSFKLKFVAQKSIESSLMYTCRYSSTRNSESGYNYVGGHLIDFEITMVLPKVLRIGMDISYENNQGFASRFNSDFLLFNFYIEKKVLKTKPLFVKINCSDLFNQFPTLERFVSDYFVEDRYYNRIGASWIIDISYRFNYFPAKPNSLK